MAESFIEEIYRIAKIHTAWKELDENLQKSMTALAEKQFERICKQVNELLDELQRNADPEAVVLYQVIHQVELSWKNRAQVCEAIEYALLPELEKISAQQASIDVSEGQWRLFSTRSGFLSLQYLPNGRFLHHLTDPMYEARLWAQGLYDPDRREYHLCGAGLGYAAYQLWLQSCKSARIVIYECDAAVEQYARHYGVLDWIDEEYLEVKRFDSADELFDDFYAPREKEPDIYRYVFPFFGEIYPTEYGEVLRAKSANEVLARENALLWRINRHMNHRKTGRMSGELMDQFSYKEWIVVAAGPSLGEQIEFLRESRGKRGIVAVSTAVRRLAKEGIRADLITAVDPIEAMIEHLQGAEEYTEGIPLLAEVNTNWNFVQTYRGPVYLCYSNGMKQFIPESDVWENVVWDVGSTVTTLALDAAIRFGAEVIYLIGVDLGYPGNQTYAEGVAHERKEVNKAQLMTLSNDGGMVATTKIFEMFREDVELLVNAYPEIKIYNLSGHGAYIRGTRIGRWWEETDKLASVSDFEEYLQKLSSESGLGWKQKYFVLWQILELERKLETESALKDANDAAFRAIYEAFRSELGFEPGDGRQSGNGMTYLFGTSYGMRPKDGHPLPELGKKTGKNPKQILLINTTEYLRGEQVAMDAVSRADYPADLKDASSIWYQGKEYPYYQFEENMPDLRFYREFLEFFRKNPPSAVILAEPYSLLGTFCAEQIRKEN